MTEEYQIKVGSMVVAGASGPGAKVHAYRYAMQYQEEGEVTVQQKINGRWRNVEKFPFTGGKT